MELRRLPRDHPLVTALLIVAFGATGGFVAASRTEGDLRKNLLTASTTLVFGALLGGVVKLLLDDVQRERDRRQEQMRFVAAMLADLKTVYDQVERTRVLIAAHRSASTYGDQMRDLIEAEIRLRNVKRALNKDTSEMKPNRLADLRACVRQMELYLNRIVTEFKGGYEPIADKQRVHDAIVDSRLPTRGSGVDAISFSIELPSNEAWSQLDNLPRLNELLNAPRTEPTHEADSIPQLVAGNELVYRNFLGALDRASWLLRDEMMHPQSERPPPGATAA